MLFLGLMFLKPCKSTHDVVVYPATVHHVESVKVHLEASLSPVLGLLGPCLQLEHGHQQAGLGELGRSGVSAVFSIEAVTQLDIVPEYRVIDPFLWVTFR